MDLKEKEKILYATVKEIKVICNRIRQSQISHTAFEDIQWIKFTWTWTTWSRSVVSDCLRPVDCSLPGPSVHGIFQARVLEWIAISFSKGPTQGLNPGLPHRRQTDALPSEPPGKSNITLLKDFISSESILQVVKNKQKNYNYLHAKIFWAFLEKFIRRWSSSHHMINMVTTAKNACEYIGKCWTISKIHRTTFYSTWTLFLILTY